MTITTSKQLAEALGPEWEASEYEYAVSAYCKSAKQWVVGSFGTFRIYAEQEAINRSPRAAVLALADKLEAEAAALRRSVKP